MCFRSLRAVLDGDESPIKMSSTIIFIIKWAEFDLWNFGIRTTVRSLPVTAAASAHRFIRSDTESESVAEVQVQGGPKLVLVCRTLIRMAI